MVRVLVAVATGAALLPAPVLAADPPSVTPAGPGAAALLIVLLLGSITAGLFFASPLRRRLPSGPAAAPVDSTGPPPAADGLVDRLYRGLAARTRSWPQMRTGRPLPSMLGGDIFGAAGPVPTRQGPWSTAPVSEERYWKPG